MARITVEDCIGRIPNHFDLTLTAARRARQLENGTTPASNAAQGRLNARTRTRTRAHRTLRSAHR